MLIKIVLAVVFGTMLSSCGTSTLNVTNDTVLRADEGLLVTTIHTNVPKYTLTLIEKDARSGTAAAFNSENPENFVIATLPAKAYSLAMFYQVGSLLINRTASFGDGFDFTIEPGKINYIGDLRLTGDGAELRIRVADNSDDVETKLAERYAVLFKKYPMKKIVIEKQAVVPFE